MTQQGSADTDTKLKLYSAVQELVAPGSINDRLRRATWGICNLIESDIPAEPASLKKRFTKVKNQLAVDHQFLKEMPVRVTDSEGDDLATELLAIFASVCDPGYLGDVVAARSAE